MNQIKLILLIIFCGISSFAKVSLVFKIREDNLLIFDENKFSLIESKKDREIQRQQQISNPRVEGYKILNTYLSFLNNDPNIKLTQNDVDRLTSRFYQDTDKFQKKYSVQLMDYIESIAKLNNAKILRDGTTTIFSIEDGIKFFKDYYAFNGVDDLFLKSFAIAYLEGSTRHNLLNRSLEKIVSRIKANNEGQTFLLSIKEYSESDLRDLIEMFKNTDYQFERVGNAWLFGSGFGYLITKQVLAERAALADATLKNKFDKIVNYHINFQIPVTHGYSQGAGAYFSSFYKEVSFVMPSEGRLNAYTHEITHSRFDKFTARLKSWVDTKGYQIPYHINGPSRTGSKYGGLFNLLNEVNSWRIGEKFDGQVTDSKIIETLVESYGIQAGYESTELLSKFWSAEKLNGKAIPLLIYKEIREFNKLTNEQLIQMGQEGVAELDLVKKMNFLIMYESNRFNGTSMQIRAENLFKLIFENSNEDSILKKVSSIDPNLKKPSNYVEPDVSKLTFEELFNEFKNPESKNSIKRLADDFLLNIKPEHIDAIVVRAIHEKNIGLKESIIELLQKVLEREGVTQTIIAHGDKYEHRGLNYSLFLKALDQSLNLRLYESTIASKKIDILNYISKFTYPVELPNTYNKALDSFIHATEKGPKDGLSIAIYFLMPSSLNGDELLWGKKLIDDLKNIELSPKIKEFIAVFYKESLGKYVSDQTYGTDNSTPYNEGSKDFFTKKFENLYPFQKKMVIDASEHLWKLAGDADSAVRTAALFAILSNPMYLVQNAQRIEDVLTQGNRNITEFNGSLFLVKAAPNFFPARLQINFQNQIQNQKQFQNVNQVKKVSCKIILNSAR